MGARLESNAGRAPLRITGRQPLKSIVYEMPVASAQVKSCLMLAGLLAEGRTEITERGGPTRDHTERLLGWLGVRVEEAEQQDGDISSTVFAVEGLKNFEARDLKIPGDISSAAFFLVAAALLSGSDLTIEDVGLNPTRAQVVWTMQKLGFDVRTDKMREECNEPVGTIRIRGSEGFMRPAAEGTAILCGPQIPQLIDELPVLAVVGTQVEGGLVIREAAELRVKETDRIAATAANLRAMGARVEEYRDGLAVDGPIRLRGARLDSHGDHRIVMAFTVAALVAEGASEMDGAECVGVSFPEFFQLLETVVER
jgi:3-phosphoshikimate 1-carboxyvinyltransferase